ncbi:MAG TPA: hypothetical protein VH877_30000, partial [Polyangia bacterium]|nr:hypothetical protein [Polyangia bacterium]
MQPPSLSHRLSLLAAAALVAFGGMMTACGNQIGASCRVNLDCSALGDRFCDVSAPGGYCTVEGCDNRSCPSGSVCIRFFQPIPSRLCNPLTANLNCAPSERCLCVNGAVDAQGNCPSMSTPDKGGHCETNPSTLCNTSSDCPPTGGACLCDYGDRDPQGNCPPPLGQCAPESSERRWCQKRCKSDGDCRDDKDAEGNRLYECRQSGTQGSEPIPEEITDAGVPVGTAVKFCVQKKR